MTTWVMSDGTEIDLGGEVRGESAFAKDLREEFKAYEEWGASVSVYPEPGGGLPLDINDPTLLEMFIRQQGNGGWRTEKVAIVSAPEFERRVFPPRPDNTPPGAVN